MAKVIIKRNKRGIVKSASFVKLVVKGYHLLSCGIQTVLKGPPDFHASPASPGKPWPGCLVAGLSKNPELRVRLSGVGKERGSASSLLSQYVAVPGLALTSYCIIASRGAMCQVLFLKGGKAHSSAT